MLGFLHAQVLQQLGCFALGFPAVHLGKLQLQVGGAVAVFLGHLGLRVEGFALLHVLPERLVPLKHGVHHREGIKLEVVLVQDGEPFARTQLHGALVGLQLAADSLEQSGLSGTVGTDYSVDVSGCELDVDVFVEDSFAKLNSKICYCYHNVFIPYLYSNGVQR